MLPTTSYFIRIVSAIIVMITPPVRWNASAVGTPELIWTTCSSWAKHKKSIYKIMNSALNKVLCIYSYFYNYGDDC